MGLHIISLLFFHIFDSSIGVDVHFVVPNATILGFFCSSWYAIINDEVSFVQLSKSPVSFFPVVTTPPSKHWSQLFVPNAVFDEQLIDLFSPSETPFDDGVTADPVGDAGAFIGDAGAFIGDAGAFIGVTFGEGTKTGELSPEAANVRGIAKLATTKNEKIFCIKEK